MHEDSFEVASWHNKNGLTGMGGAGIDMSVCESCAVIVAAVETELETMQKG